MKHNGSPASNADIARLVDFFTPLGRVAVAFSGGADSSLLLWAACRALGVGNVLGVTVRSIFTLPGEAERAASFAVSLGCPHRVVEADLTAFSEVMANGPQRCYHCKGRIIDILLTEAAAFGAGEIVEGTNADELAGEDRPGHRAVVERGLLSPYVALSMTGRRIREISREVGLGTGDIPSQSCVATRFPTGTPVDPAMIPAVVRAEEILRDHGFDSCRARIHGDLIRIEVAPDEVARLAAGDFDFGANEGVCAGEPGGKPATGKAGTGRETLIGLVGALKGLGFRFVTLDLDGYRPSGAKPTKL